MFNKVFFKSCLLLFSCMLLLISSCSVRNALSDIIDIEISKPISPAKSCSAQDISSFVFVGKSTISVKNSALRNHKVSDVFSTIFFPAIRRNYVINSSFDFQYIPKVPKYILFSKIKYFIS